jgi:hypothetical protein
LIIQADEKTQNTSVLPTSVGMLLLWSGQSTASTSTVWRLRVAAECSTRTKRLQSGHVGTATRPSLGLIATTLPGSM